jgi:O-antigen/teichoic acid export membrane protein
MASLVFGYFQGRERMGFQAASTVWTQLARGLGGAAIALITGELLPVIVWIAVTSLAQAAVSLRRLEADLGPAGRGRRDPVDWRTAFALGLVTLFALIYLRIDSVLLGWQATERDVGFYTAAYTLMAAAQIVPWMISSALTPAFARTFANDRPAFERTWQEGVRLVLLIALPLTLPLSLLAHDTVTRVYGPGFAAAGRPLAILAWCTPVWALNMVLSGVVNASGRERRLAATIGFGAALNLGINLWAIPRYGTQGAAAVTLATETTMLAGLAYILARDRVVAVPQLPMVRILAALAACAGVALALRHVEVLLALAASAVAYGAVLGATGVIDAQDLRRTRAALRRSA